MQGLLCRVLSCYVSAELAYDQPFNKLKGWLYKHMCIDSVTPVLVRPGLGATQSSSSRELLEVCGMESLPLDRLVQQCLAAL